MPDLAATFSSPAVFSRGHLVYYVDRTGSRWTVLDCVAVGGRLVVVGPASTTAGFRVFSRRDGARRLYSFQDSESRVAVAGEIERQIAESRTMADR